MSYIKFLNFIISCICSYIMQNKIYRDKTYFKLVTIFHVFLSVFLFWNCGYNYWSISFDENYFCY